MATFCKNPDQREIESAVMKEPRATKHPRKADDCLSTLIQTRIFLHRISVPNTKLFITDPDPEFLIFNLRIRIQILLYTRDGEKKLDFFNDNT